MLIYMDLVSGIRRASKRASQMKKKQTNKRTNKQILWMKKWKKLKFKKREKKRKKISIWQMFFLFVVFYNNNNIMEKIWGNFPEIFFFWLFLGIIMIKKILENFSKF